MHIARFRNTFKNPNTNLIKKESDIINYDLQANTEILEIQAYLNSTEKDPLLYDEKSFDRRTEVIDFIGFHVIDQIEALLQKTDQRGELISLKYRAEKIKAVLEEIDINLFQKLRDNIRASGFAENKFKNLVNKYVSFNLDDNKHHNEPGYDNLDIFINGLFPFVTMPEQTKDMEPEMVYYQKTPARIVFELTEKVHFIKGDVFFDLGSGLGQVAILVNLLAGVIAKGVEFEPAFCNYAKDCAAKLNLPGVKFINDDARKADYSEGTVFFMFTPFKGAILQEVLAVLKKEAQSRKIKIITYGPCTSQVALQPWLHFATPQDDDIYKLAVFTNF